jgi:hypothetical protein
MCIGSPSGRIKNLSRRRWRSIEVVSSVLTDKYTAKSEKNSFIGQRTNTTSVIDRIDSRTNDHRPYWYCEYTSQKLSGFEVISKTGIRHSLSASTIRKGFLNNLPYIYTLSITYPQRDWKDFSETACECINSFRLLNPSKEFITPEKEPWRFF